MKIIFLLLFVVSCSGIPTNPTQSTDTKPNSKILVAVLNFKVSGGQILKNHIQRIDAYAKEANLAGAKYFLLPELMIFDMLPVIPREESMSANLDDLVSMSSEYTKNLIKISKKYELNIIGASIVVKDKKKYVNRSLYIQPTGMVEYQDKARPTPWEKRHNFKGLGKIKKFVTNDFSFSILICHDAEFPTLSSQIMKDRPEVIFVPSQTDDISGLNRVKYTSAARAIEHMAFVLMTGTSGNANAEWHSYVGQNIFFMPQNKYFTEAFSEGHLNKESASIFELDLIQLRKSRDDKKQVYPARDELI